MPRTHASGDPFRDRVAALRTAWREQREVRPLLGRADRDSQYRLLMVLHGWAEECAETIRAVYGPGFEVGVDPIAASEPRMFSVRLGASMTATFALERRRQTSNWTISAQLSSLDRGFLVSIGSYRRNGPWSRARLESLVLSLLAAYERSLSSGNILAAANPLAG